MEADINEPSSKLRSQSMKGEVVEVHGGRIARSIGRKDRHSKVSTSKGPRDRRLRLSAYTAIQFYDVQDRLGYDRPSKVIDWLMEKAKGAIEALANSPRQNQHASSTINSSRQSEKDLGTHRLNLQHHTELEIMMGLNCGYDYQNQQHMNDSPINSLSFISESATAPPSSIQFQDCPPELKQDLRLSLQSLHETVLDAPHHASPINFPEQAVGSASCLSDFNATEIGWIQRTMSWNSDTVHGGEEFVFNSSPQSPQPVLCQNQLFSQRGFLQSSNLLSVSAWTNPPISVDGHYSTSVLSSRSLSSLGSARGRFSVSQTPARIEGEEQEHSAFDSPSSISSPYHY